MSQDFGPNGDISAIFAKYTGYQSPEPDPNDPDNGNYFDAIYDFVKVASVENQYDLALRLLELAMQGDDERARWVINFLTYEVNPVVIVKLFATKNPVLIKFIKTYRDIFVAGVLKLGKSEPKEMKLGLFLSEIIGLIPDTEA